MEPFEKVHRKIMCKHDDERTPEQFPSQAIRIEEVMQENRVCVKGFLAGYFQVQIDHSAN